MQRVQELAPTKHDAPRSAGHRNKGIQVLSPAGAPRVYNDEGFSGLHGPQRLAYDVGGRFCSRPASRRASPVVSIIRPPRPTQATSRLREKPAALCCSPICLHLELLLGLEPKFSGGQLGLPNGELPILLVEEALSLTTIQLGTI